MAVKLLIRPKEILRSCILVICNFQVFLNALSEVVIICHVELVKIDAQAGIDAANLAGMYVIGICEDNRLKNADMLFKNIDSIGQDNFINWFQSSS